MTNQNIILIYVSAKTSSENAVQFESNLKKVADAAKLISGCVKYDYYKDITDPNCFHIYGEFNSEENFALYRQSPVIAMIGKTLLPLAVEKPAFKHYRAVVLEES